MNFGNRAPTSSAVGQPLYPVKPGSVLHQFLERASGESSRCASRMSSMSSNGSGLANYSKQRIVPRNSTSPQTQAFQKSLRTYHARPTPIPVTPVKGRSPRPISTVSSEASRIQPRSKVQSYAQNHERRLSQHSGKNSSSNVTKPMVSKPPISPRNQPSSNIPRLNNRMPRNLKAENDKPKIDCKEQEEFWDPRGSFLVQLENEVGQGNFVRLIRRQTIVKVETTTSNSPEDSKGPSISNLPGSEVRHPLNDKDEAKTSKTVETDSDSNKPPAVIVLGYKKLDIDPSSKFDRDDKASPEILVADIQETVKNIASQDKQFLNKKTQVESEVLAFKDTQCLHCKNLEKQLEESKNEQLYLKVHVQHLKVELDTLTSFTKYLEDEIQNQKQSPILPVIPEVTETQSGSVQTDNDFVPAIAPELLEKLKYPLENFIRVQYPFINDTGDAKDSTTVANQRLQFMQIALAARDGLLNELRTKLKKGHKILLRRYKFLQEPSKETDEASNVQIQQDFVLNSYRKFTRFMYNYIDESLSDLKEFDRINVFETEQGDSKYFHESTMDIEGQSQNGIFIPIPRLHNSDILNLPPPESLEHHVDFTGTTEVLKELKEETAFHNNCMVQLEKATAPSNSEIKKPNIPNCSADNNGIDDGITYTVNTPVSQDLGTEMDFNINCLDRLEKTTGLSNSEIEHPEVPHPDNQQVDFMPTAPTLEEVEFHSNCMAQLEFLIRASYSKFGGSEPETGVSLLPEDTFTSEHAIEYTKAWVDAQMTEPTNQVEVIMSLDERKNCSESTVHEDENMKNKHTIHHFISDKNFSKSNLTKKLESTTEIPMTPELLNLKPASSGGLAAAMEWIERHASPIKTDPFDFALLKALLILSPNDEPQSSEQTLEKIVKSPSLEEFERLELECQNSSSVAKITSNFFTDKVLLKAKRTDDPNWSGFLRFEDKIDKKPTKSSVYMSEMTLDNLWPTEDSNSYRSCISSAEKVTDGLQDYDGNIINIFRKKYHIPETTYNSFMELEQNGSSKTSIKCSNSNKFPIQTITRRKSIMVLKAPTFPLSIRSNGSILDDESTLTVTNLLTPISSDNPSIEPKTHFISSPNDPKIPIKKSRQPRHSGANFTLEKAEIREMQDQNIIPSALSCQSNGNSTCFPQVTQNPAISPVAVRKESEKKVTKPPALSPNETFPEKLPELKKISLQPTGPVPISPRPISLNRNSIVGTTTKTTCNHSVVTEPEPVTQTLQTQTQPAEEKLMKCQAAFSQKPVQEKAVTFTPNSLKPKTGQKSTKNSKIPAFSRQKTSISLTEGNLVALRKSSSESNVIRNQRHSAPLRNFAPSSSVDSNPKKLNREAETFNRFGWKLNTFSKSAPNSRPSTPRNSLTNSFSKSKPGIRKSKLPMPKM